MSLIVLRVAYRISKNIGCFIFEIEPKVEAVSRLHHKMIIKLENSKMKGSPGSPSTGAWF